ncbi:hypothetical protein KJ742_00235 [Patescibacteria group bacterium]|nr:hypothetical protein [Patescibacteria group bacterium]MBU1682352.1 hypothetical protein [Patescibacteria group bacterium]MBU1935409.1 hypothetical protein [Patescibacteria group bacterium]
MKRFIATLITLMLLAPFASAEYEYTQDFDILSLNSRENNLIIEHEGGTLLLHYMGSCDLEGADQVTIAIRGTLNSNGDRLVDENHDTCYIDQAVEINGLLILDQVFANRTALVTDEKGNGYDIEYDARCLSMPRYWRDEIYLYKVGFNIATADIIYLPNNQGSCTLSYVKKRYSAPAVEGEKEEEEIKEESVIITTEPTGINLTETEETFESFLFNWNMVDNYQRQTIILEGDGERLFIAYNWRRSYMRILKRDNRGGKDLKLIVKQYDIYGQMYKDEISFSF